MSAKYREFTGLNLPSIEQEILSKWTENQSFEKSVSLREGAIPFVFYEGPPSANGMPGIHHNTLRFCLTTTSITIATRKMVATSFQILNCWELKRNEFLNCWLKLMCSVIW